MEESQNSVTHWVKGVKGGDDGAAQRLWQRYYHAMVHLARAKLQGASRRQADESDVVVEAFDSFCRDARRGGFPQTTDRQDFWRLMVMYTARKAVDQMRRQRRKVRGEGRVFGESVFGDDGQAPGLDQAIGDEPTPEFAVMMAETVRRCLAALPADHRPVAVMAMEGYTNQEVAERLGSSLSTVERRLRNIRQVLKQVLADDRA